MAFCFLLEENISRLNVLDVQQKQFVIKTTGKKQVREAKNQIAFKIFQNFFLAHRENEIKNISIFYCIENQNFLETYTTYFIVI